MKTLARAILLTAILVLTISAGTTSATSGAGVSVNPTKANHPIGKDKNISVAMQNHNKYRMGIELTPQKLTNGKWRDLDWYDFHFVDPTEKVYEKYHIKNHFENVRGTYRYKVVVMSFDKKGYAIDRGKFYTSKVYIKR